MVVIEELFAVLGFKVEGEDGLGRFSRGLDGVGNKVQGLARNITKFGAVAGAAVAGLGMGLMKLAGDAAGPLDDLIKSADRAGVSFESLQRMGFAAAQSGSSAQELGSNLEMMTARLAEAARGTGRAKLVLDAYGISATDATGKVKDANVFFLELADHMATMSEAESLDLAQKLGLSRGLLSMLRSGRDAIEAQGDIAEQAGLVFSEQNARDAEKYNDTLDLLTRSLNAMKTTIGLSLLPAMTSAIEKMQTWFNANREFIAQGLTDVLDSIIGHFETLANMDPGTLNKFLWGFGAILFIAFPLASKLAIIAVAIEDILKYMGKGESVIGNFINWFRDLTGASEGLAQSIAAVVAGLGALLLMKPGGTIKALARMVGGAAGMIGGAAAGAGAGAAGATTSGAAGLLGLLGKSLFVGAGIGTAAVMAGDTPGDTFEDQVEHRRQMREKEEAQWEGIKGWFKENFTPSAPTAKDYPQGHPLHQKSSSWGNMDPAQAAQGLATTTNNVTTNQNVGDVHVHVPPGADGRAIGQAIKSELLSQDAVRSLGTTAPSPAQ